MIEASGSTFNLVPVPPAPGEAPPLREVGRDEELLQRAERGDPGAFELIYERFGGRAFSLACRMMRDRALAQEVTQEAFLSIWNNGGRYRPERGSVSTWVLGITRRRAIDTLRRTAVRERTREATNDMAEVQRAPDQTDIEALQRLEAGALRAALDTLPDEQRLTLELSYFGGLSHTEIAQALDLRLGTVKGRIRLGLEKLRSAFGPAAA